MQNVFIVCYQRNQKYMKIKYQYPAEPDGSRELQNIVFCGNIVTNITTMNANRADLLFDKLSKMNKHM